MKKAVKTSLLFLSSFSFLSFLEHELEGLVDTEQVAWYAVGADDVGDGDGGDDDGGEDDAVGHLQQMSMDRVN